MCSAGRLPPSTFGCCRTNLGQPSRRCSSCRLATTSSTRRTWPAAAGLRCEAQQRRALSCFSRRAAAHSSVQLRAYGISVSVRCCSLNPFAPTPHYLNCTSGRPKSAACSLSWPGYALSATRCASTMPRPLPTWTRIWRQRDSSGSGARLCSKRSASCGRHWRRSRPQPQRRGGR